MSLWNLYTSSWLKFFLRPCLLFLRRDADYWQVLFLPMNWCTDGYVLKVTAPFLFSGSDLPMCNADKRFSSLFRWADAGYRNLNPEVEEGICQVLSYMWLEAEVLPDSRNMPSTSFASTSSSSSKKGGKSEVEQKLGEFFMHQIAHDASPAYGGGFRAANAAVNKYGLRRTLEHIRLTGNFPL